MNGDHSKSYEWFLRNGIPIFTNDETAERFEQISGEKMIGVPDKKTFNISEFKVTPFYVPHDGTPNFSYLISHKESGNILYSTDMERISQTNEKFRLKLKNGKPIDWSFKNFRISHMIIECNYDFSDFQYMNEFKRNHVGYGHHSLQACKRFVEKNKTSDLRTITLIHASGDANTENMRKEIQGLVEPYIKVYVAEKGLEVNIGKTPF